VTAGLKPFFVSTLGAALELGIGRPQDLMVHVTTEVLSTHLPRPLWARLFTASLGSPRLDATVIVDTLGIANIVEHLPAPLMWACLRDLGVRSLGGAPAGLLAAPPIAHAPAPAPAQVVSPPPPAASPAAPPPAAVGPAIPTPMPAPTPAPAPSPSLDDDPPSPGRPRGVTRPPFRQAPTGIGRTGSPVAARRPQAAAAPASTASRSTDVDPPTDVKAEGWKPGDSLGIDEDEQLVDWAASEETVTSGPDYERKR
jgi:hypothetical protein